MHTVSLLLLASQYCFSVLQDYYGQLVVGPSTATAAPNVVRLESSNVSDGIKQGLRSSVLNSEHCKPYWFCYGANQGSFETDRQAMSEPVLQSVLMREE